LRTTAINGCVERSSKPCSALRTSNCELVANDTLGALIDKIEIEAKQPRRPGTLGETVRVRPEAAAEVNGLRLKPDNRNYGGPTWGALLKSIPASNSCLKVKPDRRRRQFEVWTMARSRVQIQLERAAPLPAICGFPPNGHGGLVNCDLTLNNMIKRRNYHDPVQTIPPKVRLIVNA
jgi:hypothetical protein